jgi:isoamylase/glycogen operon protein
MGDEYGHTKKGNNNTWCQDNDLNWFHWNQLNSHASFYRFYRLLVHFRKTHPILRRTTFLSQKDVTWHGLEPFKPDWNSDIRFVSFTLKDLQYDEDYLLIVFNAHHHHQTIKIPPPPYAKKWRWVINTANPSPTDFYEDAQGPIQAEDFLRIAPYSAFVLRAS